MKKLADLFFQWYCKEEYYSDIKGDLEELYQQQIQNVAKWRADWMYVKEILLLFRFSLMKPISISHQKLYPHMLKHNLKIALRHMRSQIMNSSIKIGGLSIGITSCILLLLYIKHETNYDTHYSTTDRIYRVMVQYLDEGTIGVDFPAPMAQTLVKDIPEIEKAGRYLPALWFKYIRPSNKITNTFEENFLYVDQSLIEILEIHFISGDLSSALNQPRSILLTERKAKKYFPDEDPLGKTMIINDDEKNPYTITGIIKKFPSNSHLQFDFLVSLKGVEFWEGEQSYWGANMYDVYVLTKPNPNLTNINEKLSSIINNYFLPSYRERAFVNPDLVAENQRLKLQAVQDIYLNSDQIRDRLDHGSIQLIGLFGAAAFIIILIATINFINLSTASASRRIREVGIRKAIGAATSEVRRQFLTESFLYSLISTCMGIILTIYLLPYFNFLVEKQLILPLDSPLFYILIGSSILILTLMSGMYPSFYLSRFKITNALKNKMNYTIAPNLIRNSLVIFQFSSSIILIISTIVIYHQMDFILNKEVGFNEDQVMILEGTDAIGTQLASFEATLQALPHVQHTSMSDYLPVKGTSRYMDSFWKRGTESSQDGVNAQIWQVDEDYLSTLGINLSDGRNFESNIASDSQSVIISQSMSEMLDLKDPIDKYISNKDRVWRIIGVMEDFHFESLRESIYPICFVLGKNSSVMAIKMNGDDFAQFVPSITKIWEKFVPNQPIRYSFLDDRFANMHKDVHMSGRLFNSFALLSIFLACLGLLGLIAHITTKRLKEIGIRKVLGANFFQIILLLSRNFATISLLSILLASPIAWYIMENWLNGFAYRVDIHVWMFILSSGITIVIAFLTMSFHITKAALNNPIEALRME